MQFKRICAYLIDFIIVMILGTLLTSVMPNNKEAVDLSNESFEVMEEYFEAIKESDEEQIKKLEVRVNDLSYDLAKVTTYSTIITIILYFLYFIVFQSYNKGQTLGKVLFKIETVNELGIRASFGQMLLRGLILYPILPNLLSLISLYCGKNLYLNIAGYFSIIYYIIFIISFFMVIASNRGLHDRLSKTRVMEVVKEEDDGNVNKWQENNEKSKKIKNSNIKHMTGKRKGGK